MDKGRLYGLSIYEQLGSLTRVRTKIFDSEPADVDVRHFWFAVRATSSAVFTVNLISWADHAAFAAREYVIPGVHHGSPPVKLVRSGSL